MSRKMRYVLMCLVDTGRVGGNKSHFEAAIGFRCTEVIGDNAE